MLDLTSFQARSYVGYVIDEVEVFARSTLDSKE